MGLGPVGGDYGAGFGMGDLLMDTNSTHDFTHCGSYCMGTYSASRFNTGT
jgi:hypothetical protein